MSKKIFCNIYANLTSLSNDMGKVPRDRKMPSRASGGVLGRAVLDVFPAEPLAPGDVLWAHPRVTITPHHSGPTVIEDILPDILPNLRAYADGRAIAGAVDRERGY